VSRTDLTAYGFGTPWGQSWDWTNASGYSDGLSGSNATQTQAPHLVSINSATTIAVVDGGSAYFFDYYNSSFHTRFGLDATLTQNTTNHTYVMTVNGDTFTFDDFSGEASNGQEGSLLSVTDAYGDTTTVESWNSAGAPTEVEETSGSGSSEVYQEFVSTYVSSGVNEGLLYTVTQEYKVGSGSWTTIETATNTYYPSGDDYGLAGELETAIVTDAGGNIMSAAYYRYYITSGFGGHNPAGSLEYSFNTSAYELMTATLGTDLDSFSNTTVAPYANLSIEYQTGEKVSEIDVAGDGSSTAGGTVVPGDGEFSYTYTTNSNATMLDPNTWAMETQETLPDEDFYTIFTNTFGQVMLSAYTDFTTGDTWYTYYQYNSEDQLILEANPSAVTGYSTSYNNLVNWSDGSATYVSSSSGLITTYAYGSSTTATSSTAGNVLNYLEETEIQQGTGGTPVPQEAYTYLSNTAGGFTVYKVASDTVYQNSNGTGAETTSYAYTYYSGTNAIYSITTTLPTITTAQNGSGTANTTETVYDNYGRPIWTENADGYLSYTQYDPLTGAVVEQITDVNTSDTGDFSNLPSGWSTPSGGGLNLVTSYTVDDLGRVTKETNPNGTVDYFVYIDSLNEVREYDGWNSTTDTGTGPTKVTIDDWAAGFVDTLTMTATPSVSGGVPTGTESIADVQSLTRDYINVGGQELEEEDYFNLGGLTYSSSALGTSGVNYYATYYGYDDDGNRNVTIDPQGTIDITVYDGLRRVVSQWVGTDDTPASGSWSPSNNTSPSNMVETASYVYDNGGEGDSNLTQVTQYPGGSAADRGASNFSGADG
jgi:hypothetical protein